MKVRISSFDSVINIALLFPITTLLQNKISFINQLLIAFFFGLIVFSYIKHGIKIYELVLFLGVIFLTLFSIFKTSVMLYQVNDLFYFPLMILYFQIFQYKRFNLYSYLKNNQKYVKGIIIIWNIIVIVSFLFKSSYKYDYVSGGTYFCSFTDSPFRLAPTALYILILVFAIFINNNNRTVLIYGIIPFATFFMGGSRTYFIVAIFLFLIIYYCYLHNKNGFWVTIIPLMIVLLLAVMKTAIGDKIISAFSDTENAYYGAWAKITSSRSVFWKAELDAYINTSLFEKIMGKGFNFVYDVNKAAVNSQIWAHNDFLQILLTYGIVGIYIYFYSLKRLMKNTKFLYTKQLLLKICVISIWFFNAFFNMFYTYFCSMLSFPILLLLINEIDIYWHKNT